MYFPVYGHMNSVITAYISASFFRLTDSDDYIHVANFRCAGWVALNPQKKRQKRI